MKFTVTIPDWSEGCPLRIKNVEPASTSPGWTRPLNDEANRLLNEIVAFARQIADLAPEWYRDGYFIEDPMERPIGHPRARMLLRDMEKANSELDKIGAEATVVMWVNERAGYHYCDRLPEGTRIVRQ